MALLEKINSMKQSGMSDMQVVNTLKEEGITPREINEALSQLKIKSAIGSSESNTGLEPSIMQNPAENMVPQPNQQEPQYAQDQTYYTQDQQQDPNYYSQTMDIETIRDISRQETEESLKKIRAELEILNKFKSDAGFEIQNISNRLTKIESIIQEIQTAIIRKMGEYGEAVSSISQDLRETQNSFSKMINPILDKKRNIQQQETPEETKSEPKQKKQESQIQRGQDSASFEDYFR
jgi:hypothetical protein